VLWATRSDPADPEPDGSNETPDASDMASGRSNVMSDASDGMPDVSNVISDASDGMPDLSNVAPDVSDGMPDLSNVTPDVSDTVSDASDVTLDAAGTEAGVGSINFQRACCKSLRNGILRPSIRSRKIYLHPLLDPLDQKVFPRRERLLPGAEKSFGNQLGSIARFLLTAAGRLFMLRRNRGRRSAAAL
jgi:hypothetical protein